MTNPSEYVAVIEKAQMERDAWMETAAQHLRNEEYYRGLVIQIGKTLGPDVYISDDGSVQDTVLCAKVPELVAKLHVELLRERDALVKALELIKRLVDNQIMTDEEIIGDIKVEVFEALASIKEHA